MPEIGTYSLSGGRRLARQRASSDPTDASQPQSAGRSLRLDGCHHPKENLREWIKSQTSSARREYRGLDRKKVRCSGHGGAFFLTSLFIELIDVRARKSQSVLRLFNVNDDLSVLPPTHTQE